MAEEWWSSARTEDGASACSTVPGTDQDAAESAARSATSANYFRPSLHVDAAVSPPSSFLADPPHMDLAQAAYIGGGGRAAAEATTGFNALLQLHGDAGGHFLQLDQQPDIVSAAAAPVGSAPLCADSQYSSYGDVAAAAPMATKAFSQQQFSGFFASSTRSFSDVASSVPQMTTKPLLLQALERKAFESHKEPVRDACSSATRSSVSDSSPPAKKPRIATPSSLPTFKVRKEKLGDRITALQQLVSPFGKTDTASVLHEAIEYIRFLHNQVTSLSSPYLRCGRPVQQIQQKQAKDGSESKEDLRSRGLCLVPVASTYAVASETAPEFWHPTFGGTFR